LLRSFWPAEQHNATVPLMVGHRLLGISLLCTRDIAPKAAAFAP
jgi:hypothetical protein